MTEHRLLLLYTMLHEDLPLKVQNLGGTKLNGILHYYLLYANIFL